MRSSTAFSFLARSVIVLMLAGCASAPRTAPPAARQVVVMGVIDDAFFVGFATPGGAAGSSIELVSQSQGVIRCSGDYVPVSSAAGTASIRCAGAAPLKFDMNRMPDGKAFGYGKSAKGVASLTYGFDEEEAQPFLLIPFTIPIPATDPNELTRIDEATI